MSCTAVENDNSVWKVPVGSRIGIRINDMQTQTPPPPPPSKVAKLGFWPNKMRNVLNPVKKKNFQFYFFINDRF